jgi:hypothetical protein
MSQEEARQRLLEALPHVRLAMEMARIEVPGGTVGLAIIAKSTSGTGRITATFDGDEFLRDLAEVLGVADKPGWLDESLVDDDEGED